MENKTPTREPRINASNAWIFTLIKGVLLALAAIIVFIAGCRITLDTFEETYGDALVPRKNVEITISDIQYAVDTDDMSDAEKLEYISASIDTLEAEITKESK